MTQDEYNNLTDEEKNALFLDKGLGLIEWLPLEETHGFTDAGVDFFDSMPDGAKVSAIDDLNIAFMGVDKLKKDNLGNGLYWELRVIYNDSYKMTIWLEVRGIIAQAYGKTKNEAIMEATLRAKGVVE